MDNYYKNISTTKKNDVIYGVNKMSIIQIEIDDQIIHNMGEETLNNFIKSQIDYLKMKYLGDKFKSAVESSGVDHEKEFELARKKAWDEYKAKHLKDVQ